MTFLDLQQNTQAMCIVTSQPVLLNMAIQASLNRISQEFQFPYYMNSSGVITTVATYSVGKATFTNGLMAISGVGTVWTSAMVGRKIQLQGDQAHYYIASVNSPTSITIAVPYQNSGATGVSYTIYKDEYKLSPDVQEYTTIIQIQNSVPIVGVQPSKFDRNFPTQQSFDSPYLEMMEGSALDTYTSGTVTVVNGSNIVTGVSTGWLSVEGLGRMTDIIIANNRYTVKTVNSDTSITTYENIIGGASGASYTLNLRNLKTQVFPIPANQQNLYYRYYRMPDILYNPYDVPDLPPDWHWIIVWGALSWLYLQKGDSQKSQGEAEVRYMNGIKKMKEKMGNHSADRVYRRESQDGRRRISDGLEKGTFDRRYSSL